MKRNEFNRDRINDYISTIERQTCTTSKDYYILRTYSIAIDPVTNEKKLIKFNEKWPTPFIVCDEEKEKFISLAHLRTLHGGIKKTYKTLKNTVLNIKLQCVEKYVKNCDYCVNKRKKLKRRFPPPITTPIVSNSFCQRAQIDLIDVKSYKYPNCAFILNYQDNLTRFCILKPLIAKEADSIIDCLVEIFCTFGAPKILHSDNGGEFRNKKLKMYIERFWPSIHCVQSLPYTPRTQGAVERANKDVKEKFLYLMSEGICKDPIQVLNYVQYSKNISVNRTIGCSPYKAIFGQDPVIDLKAEKLSSQFTDDLELDVNDKSTIELRNEAFIEHRNNIFVKTSNAAHKMIEYDKIKRNTI